MFWLLLQGNYPCNKDTYCLSKKSYHSILAVYKCTTLLRQTVCRNPIILKDIVLLESTCAMCIVLMYFYFQPDATLGLDSSGATEIKPFLCLGFFKILLAVFIRNIALFNVLKCALSYRQCIEEKNSLHFGFGVSNF